MDGDGGGGGGGGVSRHLDWDFDRIEATVLPIIIPKVVSQCTTIWVEVLGVEKKL